MVTTKGSDVSDEQFSDAYYGGSSEESKNSAGDNRGILRGVSRKFASLDEDERSSCEMIALWRCLRHHKEGFGQKFTTSLYRFAVWECCRASAKKSRKAESRMSEDCLPLILRHVVDERDALHYVVDPNKDEIKYVLSRLEDLPYSWQRVVIRQYYVEGLTHEQVGMRNGGYSKETARLKIEQSLQELKLLCLNS